MSKIGVGGVKLAMTEKGAGVAGCAMRRGVKWRDGLWTGWGRNGGRIPVAMSPTGAMVCPTPNGVNTILCPREREHRKSNRDVEANHSAMVSNKMSLTLK